MVVMIDRSTCGRLPRQADNVNMVLKETKKPRIGAACGQA